MSLPVECRGIRLGIRQIIHNQEQFSAAEMKEYVTHLQTCSECQGAIDDAVSRQSDSTTYPGGAAITLRQLKIMAEIKAHAEAAAAAKNFRRRFPGLPG